MDKLKEKVINILENINKVILGKPEVTEEVMLTMLAGGNVLLEDIPGVGKTTLALAFSRALELDYKRIQCTPDVLPSDITGYSIYNRKKEEFIYQKGSAFCNILLADEINRASPKTQSALLEVMEEKQVTVESVTYKIEPPFMVIATQNFLGSVGTQPLPDTQLDRFMTTLTLGYPDYDNEILMVKTMSNENRANQIGAIMNKEELLIAQKEVSEIKIADELYKYIVDLIRATRNNDLIKQGGSPRSTLSLAKMSQAKAWLSDRNYVIPSDIANQYKYVINHRIVLSTDAKLNKQTKDAIIDKIINDTDQPKLGRK